MSDAATSPKRGLGWLLGAILHFIFITFLWGTVKFLVINIFGTLASFVIRSVSWLALAGYNGAMLYFMLVVPNEKLADYGWIAGILTVLFLITQGGLGTRITDMKNVGKDWLSIADQSLSVVFPVLGLLAYAF